jgi:hypothetical protein
MPRETIGCYDSALSGARNTLAQSFSSFWPRLRPQMADALQRLTGEYDGLHVSVCSCIQPECTASAPYQLINPVTGGRHAMPDNPRVESEEFAFVRRQWNNWMKGKVRADAITDLHFDRLSGGVRTRAPREFLHGYIWCDEIVEGTVAHSCQHGTAPHYIKVCIVKKDNSQAIYAKLKDKA